MACPSGASKPQKRCMAVSGSITATVEWTDLSSSVTPDLRAGCLAVNVCICRILKLLQDVGVVCLGSNLLGFAYSPSHGLHSSSKYVFKSHIVAKLIDTLQCATAVHCNRTMRCLYDVLTWVVVQLDQASVLSFHSELACLDISYTTAHIGVSARQAGKWPRIKHCMRAAGCIKLHHLM